MRFLALTTLLLIGMTRSTAAQTPDKGVSEALYAEGRRLIEAGNFAEAVLRLQESERLDPASGTELNLAYALEKAGKLASAWNEYKVAAAFSHNTGETDREALANKHAASIELRLSKLRIVAEKTPSLVVHLDALTIGEGSFGVDLPLDPGTYAIEATAPGRIPFKTTVTVGPDADRKLVTVPALAALPVAPVAATAPPNVDAPRAGASKKDSDSTNGSASTWGAQRTAGAVMAGVGVVAVVVGAIVGESAIAKASDTRAHCNPSDPTRCDPEGIALENQAKTAGAASTVLFVAGGAALAGGAILIFTARPKASPRSATASSVHLRPSLGWNGGGLALEGSW